MSTPAPARPRLRPPGVAPGGRAGAWAWLQRALSITVVGAAVITGLQLGLNAPAVSPVQQATVSAETTTGNSPALTPPLQQQVLPAPARDRTARGRDQGRGR
ncbi:hypothetical protein QFZ36_002595 [Pseudarthrobacter siccitolerans]|uniref:Uncharacterized protein n=1 Tax=Pseudarthrobacter siccitolerans TaxID=861266 RepID=A0ABU0PP56_9MICC|nr:hypothetical protein [Pseudarthrobacter siccitolerans]MDQ0675034.1 hypothetical protein [Pseudarthrobacter siccitolerans]